MSLNDLEIRALQALRAGGMTAAEAIERWVGGAKSLNALCRKGLATQIDELFVITEAGRAACPYRNPLAAPGARPALQEISMSQNTAVTRQNVLAAIVAAGPAGITRRALISRFNVGESCIDNHISLLNKALPPVIYKPEPGRCVAIEYKLAAPLNAEAQSKAEKSEMPSEAEIAEFAMALEPEDELAPPATPKVAVATPDVAPTRYAIAFPGETYDSIDAVLADALEYYEADSLANAMVVAVTPIGRIAVRPVFVPEAA